MNAPKKQITIALAISLLIHLLLITFGYIYYDYRGYTPPKEQIIEIDLQKSDWKIADITPPKVERIPEKAKHLGMYDSKVEKETVATQFPRAEMRPKSRGGEGAERVREKARGFQTPRQMKEPGKKSFRSKQMASRMPEDFYPDYKRGPHTYINVLKHPDVGYFVRLKRVFKLAWDPTHALRRSFSAGEVSRGSIKVVLGIAVSPTGEVDELFVINSSGLDAYDEEALRAVRASAPFSAPPKKLLAKDNMLRLSWTFVVYL